MDTPASTPSSGPDEHFCAFANRKAAQTVVHGRYFPLDLVPEPAVENSNIIPFPQDQIRPWHQIDRLFNGQDQTEHHAHCERSPSLAHPWQVIDGSGE